MKTPTIHLNGTSREALLEQYSEASHALQAAIRALDDAAPNGRDYYPQGIDAIKQAGREHYARIQALVSIKKEIDTLAEAVAGWEDRS